MEEYFNTEFNTNRYTAHPRLYIHSTSRPNHCAETDEGKAFNNPTIVKLIIDNPKVTWNVFLQKRLYHYEANLMTYY